MWFMYPLWESIYLTKLMTKKIISRCYYLLWNQLSVLVHTNYGNAHRSPHTLSMNFQLQSVLEFPISTSSPVQHAVFEVWSSGQSLRVILCLTDTWASLDVPLLRSSPPLGSPRPHLEPLQPYYCPEKAAPFVHCLSHFTQSLKSAGRGCGYFPQHPICLAQQDIFQVILTYFATSVLSRCVKKKITHLINVPKDKIPSYLNSIRHTLVTPKKCFW